METMRDFILGGLQNHCSVGGCDGAQAWAAAMAHKRSREELPHVQVRGGGWEALPLTRGQGRLPGGDTQRPRSSGYTGAAGPRGVIPHSRSGGVAVRRYPSSKVRSSGCTLLEQP